MRCEEVREYVEDLGTGSLPDAVRQHAAACPACKAYLGDQRLVSAGLKSLAREAPPELSVGFATRVLRGLETGRSREEFLERAGRRFVYASLVLALTLLLALLAPISGPLRSPATADSYLAEPEAFNTVGDPVLSGDPASQASPLARPVVLREGQQE